MSSQQKEYYNNIVLNIESDNSSDCEQDNSDYEDSNSDESNDIILKICNPADLSFRSIKNVYEVRCYYNNRKGNLSMALCSWNGNDRYNNKSEAKKVFDALIYRNPSSTGLDLVKISLVQCCNVRDKEIIKCLIYKKPHFY